jgi:ABC-type lipoprotein release transport system permease subunit
MIEKLSIINILINLLIGTSILLKIFDIKIYLPSLYNYKGIEGKINYYDYFPFNLYKQTYFYALLMLDDANILVLDIIVLDLKH